MDANKWFDKSLEAMDKMAQVNVDFLYLSMTKSEWAAWVQAIFSVVAICVAILIPLWQHRMANKREIVVALLLAMSVDEQLKVLYSKLKSLEKDGEEWILEIPGSKDVIRIVSDVPSMNYPSLDEHVDLSPLGVAYLRKAFAAAALIKQTKDYVDSFFSEANESKERGCEAMWRVSVSANHAAQYCLEAKKEIEIFQKKHKFSR